MKTVSVFTEDIYLFQKIRLDAPCDTEIIAYGDVSADLCLFDIDCGAKAPSGAITMSRNKEADIRIPFPIGTVEKLLSKKKQAALTLSEKERAAILRDEKIKLIPTFAEPVTESLSEK